MEVRSHTSTFNSEYTSQKSTRSKLKIISRSGLTATSRENSQKPRFAISSERFAIVVCGLVIAFFAIPLLVVIQAFSALFFGVTTVIQLLQGKGLFNEKDEL